MTRLGIEPRSSGPLANNINKPVSHFLYTYIGMNIYIYIYSHKRIQQARHDKIRKRSWEWNQNMYNYRKHSVKIEKES